MLARIDVFQRQRPRLLQEVVQQDHVAPRDGEKDAAGPADQVNRTSPPISLTFPMSDTPRVLPGIRT
jgi:hypothetical protein